MVALIRVAVYPSMSWFRCVVIILLYYYSMCWTIMNCIKQVLAIHKRLANFDNIANHNGHFTSKKPGMCSLMSAISTMTARVTVY